MPDMVSPASIYHGEFVYLHSEPPSKSQPSGYNPSLFEDWAFLDALAYTLNLSNDGKRPLYSRSHLFKGPSPKRSKHLDSIPLLGMEAWGTMVSHGLTSLASDTVWSLLGT